MSNEDLKQAQKAELFDQLSKLIDEKHWEIMDRDRELYENLQTDTKEDHSLDDVADTKKQAMIFGQLMELRKFDGFLSQLVSLSVDFHRVEARRWHHKRFYENIPKEDRSTITSIYDSSGLYCHFRHEIDLLNKHKRSDQPFYNHMLLTYCLRCNINPDSLTEDELKKLYILFAPSSPAGLYDDYYDSPKTLGNALKSRWKQREEETEKIDKYFQEEYGEYLTFGDLEEYHTEEISTKKLTTFPSFEKDFLPVFSSIFSLQK